MRRTRRRQHSYAKTARDQVMNTYSVPPPLTASAAAHPRAAGSSSGDRSRLRWMSRSDDVLPRSSVSIPSFFEIYFVGSTVDSMHNRANLRGTRQYLYDVV